MGKAKVRHRRAKAWQGKRGGTEDATVGSEGVARKRRYRKRIDCARSLRPARPRRSARRPLLDETGGGAGIRISGIGSGPSKDKPGTPRARRDRSLTMKAPVRSAALSLRAMPPYPLSLSTFGGGYQPVVVHSRIVYVVELRHAKTLSHLPGFWHAPKRIHLDLYDPLSNRR